MNGETPHSGLEPSVHGSSSPDTAPAHTPAPDKKTGRPSDPGGRRASTKSTRSRAREFALQALYQHLVGKNDAASIDSFTRDLAGFHKCDSVHYDALLHGCIAQGDALDALIVPLLDRKLAEISPVERAVMWMGTYEFQHCLDVPWRVVLNEYIELAKDYGGTDGYKYVNGVLGGLAPSLRSIEVAHDQANPPSRRPAA